MNRTAMAVREGDVCKVDMTRARGLLRMDVPGHHQFRILNDVVRQGGGYVVVDSVSGDMAMVSAYDNPVSRTPGGVEVPVSALRVLKAAFLRVAVVGRFARIAEKVASEVTDEMERQVRHFLRDQARALEKAFGGRWVPLTPLFKKEGDDTVVVTLQNFDDDLAGFRLKYDRGSDTYVFTPFFWPARGRVSWGRTSSDFYVEDLGDVSKLVYLFETAKP